MKVSLPLLLLGSLLASAPIHAQQAKIEGLGKLKVGKSTLAVIAELEDELGTKVKRATTNSDMFRAGQYSILELVPDTISRYNGPIYASTCTNAKVYAVSGYKVAGIKITDLKLTFFNSILVKIACDGSSELREAFKLKYGDGELKTEEKEVNCTFTYTGNKVAYKEVTYTQSWDSTPLAASFTLNKYYDSSCKQNILNYLVISDPATMKLVSACERVVEERRTAAQNAEKKKRLSDL